MNRGEITDKLLSSKSNSFILELATGTGKTLLALKKISQWHIKGNPILIVIPKLVLISNWKAEIKKFNLDSLLEDITFVTYVSLPKHTGKSYECLIADEAHHTSERCMGALKYIKCKHILALSATLKRDHIFFFTHNYKAELLKVNTKEAIDSNILPDPKILLIPLKLDNKHVNCIIEKNIKKTTNPLLIKTISFSEKWKYKTYKGPLRILCTAQQYYGDITGLIEWYKQKGMHNAVMKNLWLHKAGERLKWLACQKEELARELIRQLKDYRLIAFCPSIEGSNKLGCSCVNSKVGTENLNRFNSKKIKHIACIDMLTEGANLSDCKIAIFQMINSSQRLQVQKIGRALRHKKPVLVFPYYINTREEEIINTLIKDYNQTLINRVNVEEIKNIKNYL